MLMEKISDASNSLASRILLGFIAVTFVLSGVAGYVFSTTDTFAVKVNGQELSQQLFQQRYNSAYQNLSQQMGNQFAAVADTPEFSKKLREDVLNQLIDQTLLDQYAQQLKLGISKRQVETAIVLNPEFAKDGKFDNDRYLQVLRLNGLTGDGYAAIVRNNLLLAQLQNGVLGSDFVTPAQTMPLGQAFLQSRHLKLAPLSLTDAKQQVSVSDAEVKTYYDSHPQAFVIPEQVKVQYIDLTKAAVLKQVEVTPQDVEQYYQTHKMEFGQLRVAHIQVPDEALANKLYEELANGADFAKLAAEYSKDPLSAAHGGDLSWVTDGMMPKAFETVMHSLKVGEISKPVKVDNAYHIIKLEEERVKPLADVQNVIATKLRNDKAMNAFYSTEKSLNDKAFENPESLETVGKALDLPVETTAFFTRQTVPAALNYANVITSMFDSDVTQGGINSEAINVGDQHSIVVHVLEHKTAGTRTLDEAKAEIVALLKAQKAQDLVFAQAQKDADALNAGKVSPASFDFGNEETLTYANVPNPELAQEIFSMPAPQGKTRYKAIRTPNGGVMLVALDKVESHEMTANQQQQFDAQVAAVRAQVLSRELVKALREQAEIKVNQDFMQSEE